jgi:hypothetical protein
MEAMRSLPGVGPKGVLGVPPIRCAVKRGTEIKPTKDGNSTVREAQLVTGIARTWVETWVLSVGIAMPQTKQSHNSVRGGLSLRRVFLCLPRLYPHCYPHIA